LKIVQDNSAEIKKKMEALIIKRLTRVGVMLSNEMKILVNEPFPPASEDGEPPHKRTGTLQRSIQHWPVENKTVQVGSDSEYAPHLEFGTKKMGARPFIRRALNEQKKEIVKIIQGK
jgi:HK97 gp10 family phage protein